MSQIVSLPVREWSASTASSSLRDEAARALESGHILFFPDLAYKPERLDSLRESATASNHKNLSFDSRTGKLAASATDPEETALLKSLLESYCTLAGTLVSALIPAYASKLITGRTSFRPAEIAGRKTSWRKDDTRLHVDSFPSTPVHGKRILRVFSNVNPEGKPRLWRSGENFEDVAKRYLPHIPPFVRGTSVLLAWLKITKQRRSAYDHYMLKLHDLMKADHAYQSSAAAESFEFPAGSSWIVYTDQVSHAAMRGSCAFEQTFYVPVEALVYPERSPLRVLERLAGKPLLA
jgi:hypothetical protein